MTGVQSVIFVYRRQEVATMRRAEHIRHLPRVGLCFSSHLSNFSVCSTSRWTTLFWICCLSGATISYSTAARGNTGPVFFSSSLRSIFALPTFLRCLDTPDRCPDRHLSAWRTSILTKQPTLCLTCSRLLLDDCDHSDTMQSRFGFGTRRRDAQQQQ